MSRLRHEGRWFEALPGETALDTLLRHGQSPRFSCRAGACGVCAQRCLRGSAPAAARRGLNPGLRRAGYVLLCKLVPEGDVELGPPRPGDLSTTAVVEDKRLLAPDVCLLRLAPFTRLDYRGGQVVSLRHPDGRARSYSLASLPDEDEHLELHVKRVPGAGVSAWIFDTLAVGDEVELLGPSGTCSYPEEARDDDLLLVASGTGASTILGVVRAALAAGHRGRLLVYHGSRTSAGLYLGEALAGRRVELVRCVSGDDVPAGHEPGRVEAVLARRHADARGWRVFVAGHPGTVAAVEAWATRPGLEARALHRDAHGPPVPAPPEPGMWEALDEGRLLRAILEDFYTQVFADPRLGPYFHGVSQERVVGQVFGFLRDWLCGARLYFGRQPRAAHHWMVVSDEIFDHRARLMDEALRRHQLPERFIRAWHRFEESFRADVVKAEPAPLVVGGVELPLDGLGELELTVGTVCDTCQRAVEVGERVRYHLRLGTTYCSTCSA